MDCYVAQLFALSLTALGSPAQTNGVRLEEVFVKARFSMPVIKIANFPEWEFVVTNFGAVEGGKTNISDSIHKAIAACHAAGGGKVVIPSGKWLTGNVHLVRRVDIVARSRNNDGIDPEMTRNLLVEDCRFDQGDDAIAIKAGMDFDGRRLNTPSENIVLSNCTMLRGHQLVARSLHLGWRLVPK